MYVVYLLLFGLVFNIFVCLFPSMCIECEPYMRKPQSIFVRIRIDIYINHSLHGYKIEIMFVSNKIVVRGEKESYGY